MAPKRKASHTSIGPSFYHHQSSSLSKKRLVIDEEAPLAGIPTTTSTMSASLSNLTSPSLENITSIFDNLAAPSQASTRTSPIAPQTSHHIVPPPPHAQAHPRAKQPPPPSGRPQTCLIIGASRGIGLELTRQLLSQHHQVIAVVRDPSTASQLWQVTGSLISRPGSCIIEQCDISSPIDIDAFVLRMRFFIERGGSIDRIVLNAGILDYQRGLGALDVSFEDLDRHLRVNCVGNVVLGRKLIALNELEAARARREQTLVLGHAAEEDPIVVGRQVVFMSSDSGSMADFREYEDGFAAYGASKAALNMMIRHMAAELKRKGGRKVEEAKGNWQSGMQDGVRPWEHEVCVLAMHPGEVSTDMANVELGWEVEGVITAEESVTDMLRVLEGKDYRHTGTFWRWDGTQHPW